MFMLDTDPLFVLLALVNTTCCFDSVASTNTKSSESVDVRLAVLRRVVVSECLGVVVRTSAGSVLERPRGIGILSLAVFVFVILAFFGTVPDLASSNVGVGEEDLDDLFEVCESLRLKPLSSNFCRPR